MKIFDLKVNRMTEPVGISYTEAAFSFKADAGDNFLMRLFESETASVPLYEQCIALADAYCFRIDYALEPRTVYYWSVKSTETESERAQFETGIDFDAPFITPSERLICPCIFKTFKLSLSFVSARLYITGLGLYHAEINGRRVGRDYLTPGFNDYDAFVRYQTYDVTDLLGEDNRFDVVLGDGWYKGRFGIHGSKKNTFGEQYCLAAKLVIQYLDGNEIVISTDESWQVTASNIIETSIYDGETRDDTREKKETYGCEYIDVSNKILPHFGSPVREKLTLTPTLFVSPKGEQILDFHQNFVGFCRFVCREKNGAQIKLQHGEVLQDNCFYNANLRSAKAEYNYISYGIIKEVEPYFTFYGFRYIKVSGIDKVDPNDFTGVVIFSDLEQTIKVKTDNEKINRLMENAVWGQRGNFLDVPTDCPQRDERLGWTGDTQVFVNTACYHMDCYSFYKKYMEDMRADQTMYYNGDIPMYSPSLKKQAGNGGAVWADAATIIPWKVYRNYGDKELLRQNYSMMRDYTEYLIDTDESNGNTHLMGTGFTFGDWLAQDGVCAQSLKGGTDETFIRAVYYWNSVTLTANAAKVVGFDKDAQRYGMLADDIRMSIFDEFLTPNGRLVVDTQTGYVLSLFYGLYRNKQKIIEGLRNRLYRDFYKIKSGFTGTPLLLLALLDNGMVDEAYRILFSEECPGWLYAVNMGATTIWERWNSLLSDGTISGTDMNSLNHYAYGSVCEAIYSRIAGLQCGDAGWRSAIIKPHLNYRMKRMDIAFDSPCGQYRVGWEIGGKEFVLKATIPHGASAQIILPSHPDDAQIIVQGGDYEYRYTPTVDYNHPFSKETKLLDLLANEKALQILEDTLPGIYMAAMGENDEFKLWSPQRFADIGLFCTHQQEADAADEMLRKLKYENREQKVRSKNVLIKKIKLYENRNDVTLTTYVLDDSAEMLNGKKRPAVIVCPGGGYVNCSDREGEPVALRFAAMGYHAFVLRYSTYSNNQPDFSLSSTELKANKNCVYPAPMCDIGKALLTIRENAADWLVDIEKIVLCGFSAGAHNCAMYSVYWQDAVITEHFGVDAEKLRPAAAILGYGLYDYHLTMRTVKDDFAKSIRKAAQMALLGTEEPSKELLDTASPSLQVSHSTPPMFLWATTEDTLVPVENTTCMANALASVGIPFEVHIFEGGPHGLSLANQASAGSNFEIDTVASKWIELAEAWLEKRFALSLNERPYWMDKDN